LFVGIEEVGRDVPGAAVDEENGRSSHRGRKRDCTFLGRREGGRGFFWCEG
jgi:hypothetical protein